MYTWVEPANNPVVLTKDHLNHMIVNHATWDNVSTDSSHQECPLTLGSNSHYNPPINQPTNQPQLSPYSK